MLDPSIVEENLYFQAFFCFHKKRVDYDAFKGEYFLNYMFFTYIYIYFITSHALTRGRKLAQTVESVASQK